MLYRNNHNLAQKIIEDYRVILNRLQKTLSSYALHNPAVAALKQEVEQVQFNILLSDAHLNHLQKICRLLDQQKVKEPIIFRLHQAFCSELELYKRGATVNKDEEVYF